LRNDPAAGLRTARFNSPRIQQGGGEVVGFSFIVEFAFLDGRRQLGDALIESAILVD